MYISITYVCLQKGGPGTISSIVVECRNTNIRCRLGLDETRSERTNPYLTFKLGNSPLLLSLIINYNARKIKSY